MEEPLPARASLVLRLRDPADAARGERLDDEATDILGEIDHGFTSKLL